MADSTAKSKQKQFSVDESVRLIDLISDPAHKAIVLNKGRETAIVNKKNAAWKTIHAAYNGEGQRPRDLDQLKKKWENLVTQAKKNGAEERTQRVVTGGGPAAPAMSAISQKVLGILGDQVMPLRNEFDSDKDHFRAHETVDLDDKTEGATAGADKEDGAGNDDDLLVIDRPAPNVTPKPARNGAYNFSKKRKVCEETPTAKTTAQEEIVEMRKKEHEFKMKVLEKEFEAAETNAKVALIKEEVEKTALDASTAMLRYWKERSSREFGTAPPAPYGGMYAMGATDAYGANQWGQDS